MRVLDLFSGIGGFSLGLERAGMKTVAFCEIDIFCRRLLAKHWPEVPILNDITTAEFPNADVVVGGFPCQDISTAGKRAGITGERSGLYRELVRAIRMVRPKYAIVENVAALLGNGMGDVIGDLAEGGACVEWDCIPACAIGAPHQRDRVFIVRHAPDANGVPGVKRDNTDEVRRRTDETKQVRVGVGNALVHAPSDRRGQGREGRPPDSFAGIRNATRRHATDADREGLEIGQSERSDALAQLPSAERATVVDVWQSRWPCEPALLGVDDGISDRVDRVRALGNSLVPQIPEMIGRAIMDIDHAT